MTAQHIRYVIALSVLFVLLLCTVFLLQLDLMVAILAGMVGFIVINLTMGQGIEYPLGLPTRPKGPPNYQRVALKINQIEQEMQRIGLWQQTAPSPEQIQSGGAFGQRSMAFPQWLQFVFIPNVRQIISEQGKFPPSSNVAAYAVREFDVDAHNTGKLLRLLEEFDRMF